VTFLRRISTGRLLALCAATVAVAVGAAALAMAATGSEPKPPPESLPVAVHDALTAPQVEGVSGRLQFTDHLISNSDVQGGSPLLSGASGRFWASSDGYLRLELQADAAGEGGTGDTQVLSDGHRVSLFDSQSNTVYRATLPKSDHADGNDSSQDGPPSLSQVQKGIDRLMNHAIVSGAEPSDVAGQPTYTVRVEPKENGGLVGGAELAWDAVHGTPLRLAVYAKGDSSPVLELKATDISYGPVDASVFDVSPPSDAKVVDLNPSGGGTDGSADTAPITGVGPVQSQLSFPVAAPDALAGQQRNDVRLIQSDKDKGALVTYGQGLGGIAVLERQAQPDSSNGDQGQVTLPTVSIDGVQGQELATPLGTMVRFESGGVEYTVLGSVSPANAEAAARALH
jgi:outer membrane lipoprotein-sorting protein